MPFWEDSLTKPPFGVTSAEVIINCPDMIYHPRIPKLQSPLSLCRQFGMFPTDLDAQQLEHISTVLATKTTRTNWCCQFGVRKGTRPTEPSRKRYKYVYVYKWKGWKIDWAPKQLDGSLNAPKSDYMSLVVPSYTIMCQSMDIVWFPDFPFDFDSGKLQATRICSNNHNEPKHRQSFRRYFEGGCFSKETVLISSRNMQLNDIT